MALLWACLSASPRPPSSFLQSDKHTAISRPSISRTQIPTAVTHTISSLSVSAPTSYCYPSLQFTSYCSNSTLCDSTDSDTSSPTGVFIKGLSESTMEGRLKKVFSQFGEVEQVKLVTERKSKQSLGSAFVWFARKDSAELAVKEMNGKFFDGRFILVKFAEPQLSKNRGRKIPYKF